MNENEIHASLAEIRQRVEHLESDAKGASSSRKSILERLEKVESNDKLINYQYEQIEKKLQEIVSDLRTIKEKPAQKWDAVTMLIISGIVSAIITFLTNFILK